MSEKAYWRLLGQWSYHHYSSNISRGEDREYKVIFTFGEDSQVGFNNLLLDRRSFINEAKELEEFHRVWTKVQLEKVYTDLSVHID